MSDRLKALREARQRAVTEMRAITDKAAAEKRDLTDEELAKHSEIFTDIDKLRRQIEAEERSEQVAREQARREEPPPEQRNTPAQETAQRPTQTAEYRAAFNQFLRLGPSGLNGDEIRALSAGVGSQGGFTVVPEQFASDLIRFLDDDVVIRGLATTMPVMGAASLGVPSLESDIADADWTSELAIGSEDNSMAFGKRKLVPSPLAKLIKVSNDLLRATAGAGALNVEMIVRQRLGYKFGISQEKGFLLGNGTNQPLGLFVASNDGIPTSRDISSGNTSTSIGMDGLIAAKYALKGSYRRRARWLFHRNAVEQIAKLKDTTNQYLWQPSNQAGQPDMLLGIPVLSSEFVPNTFTTGLYVGMLADFSFYWIADAMNLEIQRLVELFAATNQTGFVGRAFTDGMPVLGEAFARIKLA